MLLMVEAPGARVRFAGIAESVNPGAPVIAKEMRAVLVELPDVPVMVTEELAGGAELLAAKVSVLLVMALAGLNDAVTPVGSPEAARFTTPVKPC